MALLMLYSFYFFVLFCLCLTCCSGCIMLSCCTKCFDCFKIQIVSMLFTVVEPVHNNLQDGKFGFVVEIWSWCMETAQPAIGSILVKVCRFNYCASNLDVSLNKCLCIICSLHTLANEDSDRLVFVLYDWLLCWILFFSFWFKSSLEKTA